VTDETVYKGGLTPFSVLVLRPGAVGDTLFAFPVLRRLREAWPRARLVAAGREDALALAEESGFVDEALSFESIRPACLFAEQGEIDPFAREFLSAFGLVLSLGFEEDVFLRRLREGGAREVHGIPFLPPEGSGEHAARWLLGRLHVVGLEGGDPVPRVFPSAASREKAQALLSDLPPPFLAVHPGSGGARKNWPAERFARVAQRFVRETGGSLVLLAGYADEGPLEAMRQATETFPGRRAELVDRPLSLVAAFLERASVYLGNDSGITHLAAAVGAPVVALFGASDPRRFAPLGERVRVLAARSMDAIGEEEVHRAIESVFSPT
jgi:heptosyltransferase-2